MTENLFWRFSFSNFCIISYRLTFVKNFFNFFEILFPQVVRFWPSATFISYHRFKCLSRTFLSFFEKLFELHFSEAQFFFLLATFTSYHRWSCLSRTFLFFLKTFFKFLSSSSATSDIIPYHSALVNNFFYFFEKNFKKIKNRAKQPHFIHILLYISLKSFILSWTFL